MKKLRHRETRLFAKGHVAGRQWHWDATLGRAGGDLPVGRGEAAPLWRRFRLGFSLRLSTQVSQLQQPGSATLGLVGGQLTAKTPPSPPHIAPPPPPAAHQHCGLGIGCVSSQRLRFFKETEPDSSSPCWQGGRGPGGPHEMGCPSFSFPPKPWNLWAAGNMWLWASSR